jgi:hypothetical protein
MPRHSLLHKLNIHPKYLSMHRRLLHFNNTYNPKLQGGKLTNKFNRASVAYGEAMINKRRPTPLQFNL